MVSKANGMKAIVNNIYSIGDYFFIDYSLQVGVEAVGVENIVILHGKGYDTSAYLVLRYFDAEQA